MKHISLKLAVTSLLLLSGPADSFDIEPLPLFLSNQVDPNLILTLDDSGSMRRGYVPETCDDNSDCAALDNRWAKSAHGNGLYYNPRVIYSAPVGADAARRSAPSSMPPGATATTGRNPFSTSESTCRATSSRPQRSG